ncbi:Methylthioribose kinase [Planctomycetes bacterium MalM25]|nr:Methylthioribose kinase [Planctomycetes bacterium MalM25]
MGDAATEYDDDMTPDEFRRRNPDCFFLACDEREALGAYLVRLGVIGEGEHLRSVAPAGAGNMNLTLRVVTNERSLIVKQSRPWVERYPSIAAPWDRVLGEARFYRITSEHPAVATRMPGLFAVGAESRVLVLEDLGESSDYTSLYQGKALLPDQASTLAGWLSELHAIDFEPEVRETLPNLEMRQLNHEHIFRFPFDRENGLDIEAITPGLSRLRDELATSKRLVRRVQELGEIYLSPGPRLIHGDFFPGSWLAADEGPAVIDPEFAFFGPPEFDMGVFLAHLFLANQEEATGQATIKGYKPPPGFDHRMAFAFCGVEIMRRLLGVAQLPINLTLDEKRRHLLFCRDELLNENSTLMQSFRFKPPEPPVTLLRASDAF